MIFLLDQNGIRMTVHPTTALEYHPRTSIVPFAEMARYLRAWKEESEAERPKGRKQVRGFGRVHGTQCSVCKNAFQDEYSEDVYMPVCGCHIHKVCEEIGSHFRLLHSEDSVWIFLIYHYYYCPSILGLRAYDLFSTMGRIFMP
jgi:hypothetical protein